MVMLPVGAGSVTHFESLARGFVERYRDQFRRAMEVFAQGLAAFPSGKHGEEVLTYLDFPGIHQRHIKSTNAFVCYLTPTPRV
jgi:transposase-like protein